MKPNDNATLRRLTRSPVWFLAALTLLLACQAGGGSGSTAVELSEFKFQPNEITATAGRPVKLTLRNTGTVAHDFTVKDLDVASPKVQPRSSAEFAFTPSRTGTFQIICTEPGHQEGGMVGTLTVR